MISALHIGNAVADGVLLGIAVVGHAEDHLAAVPERAAGDVGHRIRQIDRDEVGAASEGVAVDGLDALGQGQLLQTGAAVEGGAADGGQFAAIGKAYRLQAEQP